jgi:hypothetical protein
VFSCIVHSVTFPVLLKFELIRGARFDNDQNFTKLLQIFRTKEANELCKALSDAGLSSEHLAPEAQNKNVALLYAGEFLNALIEDMSSFHHE